LELPPNIPVFDSAGRFLFKWGSHGSGDGQFSIAQDVAVSPAGTVYVVDDGNSRVQVFDSLGTFIRKWGRRGPNAGEFESPKSLVIDSNGSVI
jgi:DNA-binding beta-propeller fold protein YncE